MKKLVLIDGKSVYYRGYYAMGHLSRRDGRPTGGVYGFAVISLELVRRLQPDKVVVAWDSKSSTARRRAIYPEYKAGRHKPPEDFYAQLPDLVKLVDALGWELVEIDEYEADDIIGTLSKQASEEEWEAVIISSDLDMLQVVDERVKMYRLLKGFSDLEEMDIRAVEEKYGIRKSQFLDLKALKGDASDNIPGVPGVGEKGAVKLLNDYGSLEEIYAHLGEIGGATGRKLAAGQESAFMSKTLATIMTDAPVSLAEVRDFVWDWGKVKEELQDLEFNSLIRKFEKDMKAGEIHLGSKNSMDDEKSNGSEKINENGKSGRPAGGNPMDDEKLNENNKSNENNEQVPDDLIISWDVKKLMHENPEIAGKILGGAEFWDLGQGSFLLWGRGLGAQAEKSLSAEKEKSAKISTEKNPKIVSSSADKSARKSTSSSTGKNTGLEAVKLALPEDPITPEKVKEYIITDEEKQEYLRQKSEMSTHPRIQAIFKNYDLPLMPVLYRMEQAGIQVDLAYFRQLEQEFSAEVQAREAEIIDLAGVKFNLNSPMQLSEVLFEKLGLPTAGIKKTTRGYSTGAKELAKMRDLHPVVGKILEYREVAKLLSTYVLPVPKLADAAGRIHTTFTQNVTATGRLSSVNPNLQNIPVRTEEGRRIRRGYVAGQGRKFVSADYAQFELRLAAVLAGDRALIDDFNAGVDIHTKTAADVFKVRMDEVTAEQRRAAKTINFGVLYGMSAKGLAEATGMSLGAARDFIEGYFTVRRPIREYLDRVLQGARENGYVETYYGRRRMVPEVRSGNFVVRAAGERAAANMPIQGTEADLVKRSMILVDKALQSEAGLVDARLVLQVHDSIMVECAEGEVERVSEILKTVMEGVAPELPVKLAVDLKVSDWWV